MILSSIVDKSCETSFSGGRDVEVVSEDIS
jgi:hypothetical protein